MRLIASSFRRAGRKWPTLITCCVIGVLVVVGLFTPSPAQGSVTIMQMTATIIPETVVAASFPADDALVPDAALTRFNDIPNGLGKVSSSTLSFPYLGNQDAPIKITQVSSYSCAACQSYYRNITLYLLPTIRSGQVQFTLIPVTLTGEYDPSNEVAAALCALDQGAFWQITDVLFTWKSRYEQAASDGRRLEVAAVKLGLNLDKFNACIFGPAVTKRISANNQYYSKLNLKYTPSILVNGRLIDPPPTLNQLYRVINQTSLATPSSPDNPTSTP